MAKKNVTTQLASRACIPCKGGVAPVKGTALKDLAAQLPGDWKVIRQHHLEREFEFKNFREALAFTNRVGKLAEKENHHPDIFLSWGKVITALWTHKIDGLTESDFIMAAKIERLPRPSR
jgi:4a-hydroxytetrahydrobiopterin dehydratase